MIGRRAFPTNRNGALSEPLMDSIVVPSRIPGADFRIAIQAELVPHGNQEGRDADWKYRARVVAFDHIRSIAEKEAARRLVPHFAVTELAINATLITPLTIHQPIEVTVNGRVEVRPAYENDRCTGEYLDSSRAELIRNDHIRERLEFHRSVFSDRHQAWLWWIDQEPEKLQLLPRETYAMALTSIEEAASAMRLRNQTVKTDSFAQVIGDFIRDLDVSHATLAIGLLRQYLSHFDRQDLVMRVDLLHQDPRVTDA